MAVRMSGMISGLDTDSLVQSLIEAQKLKNKKTVDKKTKLEWTQEKWQDLNKKLYKLYTDQVGKLRLQSSYGTKKVTCTNEDKVKITGNSTAPLGSQSLKISELATAGYLTGSEISTADGGKVTSSTKLSELGITSGGTLNLTVGSTSKYIEVTKDTTVSELLTSIRNAGVNASLDVNNQRIFISSKKTGLDSDFSLTATSAEGNSILSALGLTTGSLSAADKANYTFWGEAAGLAIGYDDDGKIVFGATLSDEEIRANITAEGSQWKQYYDKELQTRISAYKAEKEKLEASNTELTKQNGTLEAQNENLQDTYDDKVGVFNAMLADDAYASAFAEVEAEEGYADLTDDQKLYKKMDKAIEILNKQVTDFKEAHPDCTDENNADYNAYQELVKQAADVTEALASKKQMDSNAATIAKNKATINSNEGRLTVVDGKLETVDDVENAGVVAEVNAMFISKAKYAKEAIEADVKNTSSENTGALKIDGVDAKFTLNGVEFTSASNETTVNGVTLTLTGTTAKDEVINFTVTNDTDAVYNMIKDFINEYNTILEEMNTLYYAESARGYDPLSDDEREAMSDTDIEKWETKIKNSLLRRDTSLGSVMDAMKNAMLTSVTVDGKRYSLASFGIGTSSAYTERGKQHIQGDEDDDTYSASTNKLREALESDPDTVMQVFSGVMTKLYSTMQDKMKKTTLSSSLTFYNDVYMKNQLVTLNKQIAKDEDKLTDLEDKYYNQFAAMETALAKLQSQQNQLAGYLG